MNGIDLLNNIVNDLQGAIELLKTDVEEGTEKEALISDTEHDLEMLYDHLEDINALLEKVEVGHENIMNKVYIVACRCEPFCIVIAKDKKRAEAIALLQADEDLGECDENWQAYEISEYFDDLEESEFYGWIKAEGQSYLKFA